MPLLATLIGSIASGLVAMFSRFMAYQLALKLAAYTAWIAVVGTFAASVFVCASGLIAAASGMFNAGTASKVMKGFGMGLGMLIPSNAATVIGCMASVWIACQVYKIQRQGMHYYSK